MGQLIRYHSVPFFQKPTEKNGNDEDEIYFDAEHIYIKHFPEIYYYKDLIGINLKGRHPAFGGIEIFTDPQELK
jgi:hypothetical protein